MAATASRIDTEKLPLWLRVEEAAEVLGVSRAFVFSLIRRGELDSRKVGRLRRIPREALLKFAA
jgi:excisionase family DNA binding protein